MAARRRLGAPRSGPSGGANPNPNPNPNPPGLVTEYGQPQALLVVVQVNKVIAEKERTVYQGGT